MKRVLLDTNIYGNAIERGHIPLLRKASESKALKGKFVVYGLDLIRKELRAIPHGAKVEGTNLRTALLQVYDFITGSHVFPTTHMMRQIADEYYLAYSNFGGKEKKEGIIADFQIVAAASLHELDVVYSEDCKTLLHESSLKSYTLVNALRKLRNPRFEKYDSFIKEIKRLSP
jgi:hypothetical protein